VKTDNLFYHIFNDLPEAFFALIGLPESEAKHYKCQSVELKQTSFRIDAMFQPKNGKRPTFFVEAQFQHDKKFYRRFFLLKPIYICINTKFAIGVAWLFFQAKRLSRRLRIMRN
jgi:predicted transposase YdaD